MPGNCKIRAERIASIPLESSAPASPATLLEQARRTASGAVDAGTAETVLLRIIEAGDRQQPAAAPAASAADGTYILQIGAFAQAARAQRLRDKVIELGLNSYVQRAQGGETIITRVRVGTFNSLSAAKQAQATLAKHGIHKSVLIRN